MAREEGEMNFIHYFSTFKFYYKGFFVGVNFKK